MTPTEAAALAVLNLHNRQLVAAILRILTGRATADDLKPLPPPKPGEPILSWLRLAFAHGHHTGQAHAETWASHLAQSEREASTQLERGRQLGVMPLPLFDPRYPPLLAAIPDPPPLLWIRGEAAALSQPAVAIVGSRAATPYGLAMAATISRDLATAGLVIVSGLARGIDSAAHGAALSAHGKTVGVLGCGIDRVYPAEHRELARNMEHAGAVVSEFPPGVPPLPHHFPMRNRIISGLAAVVVVVEAPEKSGALITASAALEQGRDVMVVPGPATGGRNRGGHLLIRDGARVVESADDILQELGAVPCSNRTAPEGVTLGQLPESVDFTVDDVARRTGELPNIVLARLLDLELAGRVQRIGGGRFVRV
jgi:DNA processing protein